MELRPLRRPRALTGKPKAPDALFYRVGSLVFLRLRR